ncbi:PLAC8 motif-containing protein [Phytophthora cactorum]|nr:PLAC8 motif-containing protein [Phytophthora cactorum]
MQTPSNETSYVVPVFSPQVNVAVRPDAAVSKERKLRDEEQRVGATHVTDSAKETGKDWDTPFFGCFASIMPNCCMSTICPCVSVAQIQVRLGNCYTMALFTHGATIFGLIICIILFISHSVTTDVIKSPNSSHRGEVHYLLVWAVFFALFLTFSVCLVRMKVRKQYEIKGTVLKTVWWPVLHSTQSYTPGVVNFQNSRVDTLPGYPATPAMPMYFI